MTKWRTIVAKLKTVRCGLGSSISDNTDGLGKYCVHLYSAGSLFMHVTPPPYRILKKLTHLQLDDR